MVDADYHWGAQVGEAAEVAEGRTQGGAILSVRHYYTPLDVNIIRTDSPLAGLYILYHGLYREEDIRTTNQLARHTGRYDNKRQKRTQICIVQTIYHTTTYTTHVNNYIYFIERLYFSRFTLKSQYSNGLLATA